MPHACGTPFTKAAIDGIRRGVAHAQASGVDCEVPQHFVIEGAGGEQELIPIAPPVPRRVMAIGTNRDTLLAILLLNQDSRKDRFQMLMVDSTSLPKDLAIEEIIFDIARDLFLIVVTSETFEEVKPQNQIPLLNLPVEQWDVARILPDQIIVDEAWVREEMDAKHPNMILVNRNDLALVTYHVGMDNPVRSNARSRLRKLLNPDIKEAELGPKMPIEFPDWDHPDHATEMRDQTDLLKQIRDALTEGKQEAFERVTALDLNRSTKQMICAMADNARHSTAKSRESVAERDRANVEAWNRQKGIIKPNDIILSREVIVEWRDALLHENIKPMVFALNSIIERGSDLWEGRKIVVDRHAIEDVRNWINGCRPDDQNSPQAEAWAMAKRLANIILGEAPKFPSDSAAPEHQPRSGGAQKAGSDVKHQSQP